MWMNRLKRNPDPAHKAGRFRVEMHRIAMNMLLSTHWKIQRLESKGLTPPAAAQQLLQLRQQRQFPHCRTVPPSILQAQITLASLSSPGHKVETLPQVGLDALGERCNAIVPEIHHGESLITKLLRLDLKRLEITGLLIERHRFGRGLNFGHRPQSMTKAKVRDQGFISRCLCLVIAP